ncbi:MAG: hypothetical protein KJZ66_08050, partial [Candidatus Kuenenia stuttgartiensis]|nr:hypothetical protein [Candidatus Kuenenia stuttgartiensis]
QKKIVRNKMDWHQKSDTRGKTDLKKDMSTSTMKKQYSFIKTKTTRPLSANIKTAPRPLKHK